MKKMIAFMLAIIGTATSSLSVQAGETYSNGTPKNNITSNVYFINDMTNNYNNSNVYNNGSNYYDPQQLNQERLNNLQQRYPNWDFTGNNYYNTYNNYNGNTNIYNGNVTNNYTNIINSNNNTNSNNSTVNSNNNTNSNNTNSNNTNSNNSNSYNNAKEEAKNNNEASSEEAIEIKSVLTDEEIAYVSKALNIDIVSFNTSYMKKDVYWNYNNFTGVIDFSLFAGCKEESNKSAGTIAASFAGIKTINSDFKIKNIYEYVDILKQDGYTINFYNNELILSKKYDERLTYYVWINYDGNYLIIDCGLTSDSIDTWYNRLEKQK